MSRAERVVPRIAADNSIAPPGVGYHCDSRGCHVREPGALGKANRKRICECLAAQLGILAGILTHTLKEQDLAAVLLLALPVVWVDLCDRGAVYVVFKGTDQIVECVINVNASAIPVDPVNCPIGVHSGMWAALHPFKTPQQHIHVILSQFLERYICPTQQTPRLVLCGHSLGGGYATLATIELLHTGYPEESIETVTFGCPQVVIQPPHLTEMSRPRTRQIARDDLSHVRVVWNALHARSIHYVHAYDCVPRLTFSPEWLDVLKRSAKVPWELVPLPSWAKHFLKGFNIGSAGPELILGSLKDVVKQIVAVYEPVGTLYFVRAGARFAEEHAAHDASGRELLAQVPKMDRPGMLVIEHHLMGNYIEAIKNLPQ